MDWLSEMSPTRIEERGVPVILQGGWALSDGSPFRGLTDGQYTHWNEPIPTDCYDRSYTVVDLSEPQGFSYAVRQLVWTERGRNVLQSAFDGHWSSAPSLFMRLFMGFRVTDHDRLRVAKAFAKVFK